MNRRRLILLLFSVIIAGMTSCTPESCVEKTDSLLDVSFYVFSTRKAKPPDSLTVYGLGFETNKIYSASKQVKFASLPLNSASDNSVFIIKIDNLVDTLSVFYSSYPHLISKECGYTFYHDLDNVVHSRNAIDSVWINNRTVTNLDEENIRIYY
jgi:hypothetical protein